MRLAVSIQRAVIQYIASTKLSNRYIADIHKISPTTVAKLRLLFHMLGKTWEEIALLDDDNFKAQLGTSMQYKKNSALIHPNYAMVHLEMQTRDMTLKLLHLEYLASMDDKLEQTISYSTFSHTYSAWIKKQRISMRQAHKVGDKMFVDFCGKTIPITNMKTGEIVKAQIFVAVLGASRYTFAYAVPSQKINDWLSCHIQAFEYFEGVPNQVVPDNLKAAVIQNKKDEIILNQSYINLSEYYQFIISPTRIRKPKDKSLAEISVQIIQRWILAPLRHHKFFSIEELNKEISKGLDILNNKQTKSFVKSRRSLFLEIEKRALKPLPNEPYLINEWRYKIKVPNDYHIEHDGHFYSIPYHHIGQNVDIRVGEQIIEIFIHNQRITSHIRKFDRGLSTHLEHCPIEHQEQAMNEPDALITWSNSLRHYTSQWVKENLQNRRDFANGLKSVKRLRTWLREEQNLEEIESACEFVLKYRILGFRSLMDTIKNKHYMRNITPPNMPILQHNNIRGANYYKDKK